MDVAIPIFDRITALDAVGPYEVLQLTLVAEEPLSAVPHPEIIVVPGGFGTRAVRAPNPLLDWLRAAHETSQWTTSVCTGSLLPGPDARVTGD